MSSKKTPEQTKKQIGKNYPNKKIRLVKIILIILFIIIATISVFIYWPIPKEQIPKIEQKNSEIYSSLATAGFEDAVVDIQENKIIIDFIIKDNTNIDGAALYALGAIGEVIKSNKEIDMIVKQNSNEYSYKGTTSDIQKAINKEISVEELLNQFKS